MSKGRRRKQKANALGLNDAELQLCELLAQVLELLRWNQVLGYSNQYLLHEKLGVSAEERHRVMRAAAGAVEQDGRLQEWGRKLLDIQTALERIQAGMHAAPRAPAPRATDGDGGADGATETASGT